jgi:hypothetical protein
VRRGPRRPTGLVQVVVVLRRFADAEEEALDRTQVQISSHNQVRADRLSMSLVQLISLRRPAA